MGLQEKMGFIWDYTMFENGITEIMSEFWIWDFNLSQFAWCSFMWGYSYMYFRIMATMRIEKKTTHGYIIGV